MQMIEEEIKDSDCRHIRRVYCVRPENQLRSVVGPGNTPFINKECVGERDTTTDCLLRTGEMERDAVADLCSLIKME